MQAKIIQDNIEKKVQKAKPEGTDITKVVQMAAQGVANNIARVEQKKVGSPAQEPFIPPIMGQKMNVPVINNFDAPKGRPQPPQSAKPYVGITPKEQPQSARVAHTGNDWNKKPVAAPIVAKKEDPKTPSQLKESPQDKLKLEQERKKIRDEGMKKWR